MEEVINDYISGADSEPIQESYDKHNMPYLSKKTKKKMAMKDRIRAANANPPEPKDL